MARRGSTLGVELNELAGDLSHSGTRLTLGVLPVRAAHLGQARAFPTGVLAQQVQRVHGHPQLVAGLATLGGLILQHDVLAAGVAYGALGHLHKFSDAVSVMHDVIPRLERQRINAVAAAWGAALGASNVAHAVTRHIGFGEHNQARASEGQTGMRDPLIQRDLPVNGLKTRGGHARGHTVFTEAIRHAVDRAFGGRDEGGVTTVLQMQLDLAVQGLNFLRVTLGCRRRLVLQGQRDLIRHAHSRGRKGPPCIARLQRGGLQRLEGTIRAGRHVQALSSYWALSSHRGCFPTGFQKFLISGLQVSNTGAHLLRGGHQHYGTGGHERRQYLIGLICQRRDERLHAVRVGTASDPLQHLHQGAVARVGLGEGGGAGADGVVDKQLACWMQLNRTDVFNGALISDGEGAQFGHFVAPEFDAHGVLGRRGEHVDDAAARGKFAAAGHHVHVAVRKIHQALGQLPEIMLLIHGHHDGLHRRHYRLAGRAR